MSVLLKLAALQSEHDHIEIKVCTGTRRDSETSQFGIYLSTN